MATIQLDNNDNTNVETDSTLDREVNENKSKPWRTYMRRGGSTLKRGTKKTVRAISKLNLYEWWFNLSTRRRATRRAKQEYKTIVKNERRVVWDDTIDDYGTDGQDGLPTIPPVPEPPDPDPLGWDPYGLDVIDNLDWNLPPEPMNLGGPEPIKPKYRRGGRARDLAYAIELHFGKLPYDKANHEVARRFASRHKLVETSSVRYSHRAALVKRALHLYFVTLEDDLVDHFVVDNHRNDKRTKQLRMTKW